MGAATLCIGLLLSWLLGIAALVAVRDAKTRADDPGEIAWLAGAGYPAGALLVTLWMRGLALVGVRFGALSVALPLVVATIALAYAGWRRHGSPRFDIARISGALRLPPEIGGTTRILWWALVAGIALHLAFVGYEVAVRPLYPWEAWIAWATKARVWFEQGTIVPFVDTNDWLAANGTAWFDASPRIPPTLPLLQVYACIALGRWDDALMNWPWWQFALALALVTYGGLRRLGTGALAALIGASFVASLPLANVHVALAGVGELPLAVYYTTSVLAFLRWAAGRNWRDALAAALFVAAGMLVKGTAVYYALALLPGIVAATMPRRGRSVIAAAFALVLLALAVLAQTNFAWAGRSLHLEFEPAWPLLAESLFVAGNWNLLWYGSIGTAVLAWRQLATRELLPLAAIVAAGLLFIAILFAFPEVRAVVSNQQTIDRAALPIAPVLIVFMIVAFRAFGEHWRATHEPSAAAVPTGDAAATPPAATA